MQFLSSLPWYMFDLHNLQLITSVTIPEGEIKDSKSVVITETPIPGRNFQPISTGGNGNRTVSFTLPILKRSIAAGNVMILKQFDLLRNQAQGLLGLAALKGQFSPNPKVLYSWGIGSVPLVWYVSKCDFRHTSNMVNGIGNPQLSYVEIELKLDETHPLYKAEESFRNVSAVIGEVESLFAIAKAKSKRNPF
jgi:hypothetical protein